MRIIKLAIISFIVLFLVITGMSLFIPSHIRISKAIDINADKNTVMAQLNDPQNWQKWYPLNSFRLLVIEGKVKGISTDSMHAITITKVTDSSVLAENTGPRSKRGETGWNIFPGNNPNSVTVQWYRDFHLRWYPWEKFRSLLFEKTYGAQMEKGLNNLKTLLEK